jgi:glycosyltransferase involved in cell wall biosynthesis
MIDIQLSVVIGCYNQLDALKKVLPQFAKQTRSKSDFEVILVDSTSTDGSLDFYQSYKAEFNLIIHVQKNSFFMLKYRDIKYF